MHTNELSLETYTAVIVEAENFHEDLPLHFGAIASDCEHEAEYLQECKRVVTEIKNLHEDQLRDVFFGNPPNKKALHKTLDKILQNVVKVEKIPESNRNYDL